LLTKVHIASDKMKRTCSINSVTEESVACTSGCGLTSFPRTELKSVKIVRHGRSALGGAAIGAGVGFILGFAGSQGQDPHAFLKFDPAKVGGVTAVFGRVVGAAVRIPTGFLRGDVYERPKS
jgi:hypothetical protein